MSSGTLTNKQHDLLNFIEQVWYLNGAIPTRDVCVGRGICSGTLYDDSIKSDLFRAAMDSRGISVRSLDDADNGVLTEEQLAAANTMLDLRDNRSQKKKLADLGIPTQKWEAWLRDAAFQAYLRQRAENLLGDNIHESHLALVDRVRSGDINAIKYYNEITGRYTPRSDSSIDVNIVLLRVLETIQKHVKDPLVLEAIGDDLASITGSVTPVGTSLVSAAHPPRVLEGI